MNPARPSGALIALVCVSLLAVPAAVRPQQPASLADLVDPFIGAGEGGNTVPGAGVPFGFVRLSPDTTKPSSAGYNPAEAILGFSHTHAWLLHSEVAAGGRLVLQMGPQPSDWARDMARDHLLGPEGLPTWP